MIDTDKYEEFENAMNEGRIERVHCLWALAEVKRLREENDALLSAIDMCIVTQMNSVENGFRYQSGGCFEHYSYWQHEKVSEEE